MTRCRSCKAPIIWSTIISTRRAMPLDAEQSELKRGIGAHNSITGFGTVIADELQLSALRVWTEPGVSYHRPHWVTCPHADEHRHGRKR